MFKSPFDVKNDSSIIENMFNIIKEFCLRKNNQHDANLIGSMVTLMKANFDQFVMIFPNVKNDILRNYDKKDKDYFNAYFKVIEDQIAQHHIEDVVNEMDVEEIEKLQENIQLTPDQIRAAEELKKIVEKEKSEETFKDEIEHFVDATKELISFPMHKHVNEKKKINMKQELNNQININETNNVANNNLNLDKEIKQSTSNNVIRKENDISQNELQKTSIENNNQEIKLNQVSNDKITNPIVNLILSQLKDVVGMMNELSGKMKEVEKNNLTAVNQLGDLKENVKNYNDRIETLENNVEKFIGLYEVFMNEYNPFLDNDKKN